MELDRLNTFMTKYPFDTFESIPKDSSGLVFPPFENIKFSFSPRLNSESAKVVYVDGLAFLKILNTDAFCIDPRRWHKVKTYIAKGHVIYPEASTGEFGVSDGRHRTLLLMQLYNRRTVPVAIADNMYEKFISDAKIHEAI